MTKWDWNTLAYQISVGETHNSLIYLCSLGKRVNPQDIKTKIWENNIWDSGFPAMITSREIQILCQAWFFLFTVTLTSIRISISELEIEINLKNTERDKQTKKIPWKYYSH